MIKKRITGYFEKFDNTELGVTLPELLDTLEKTIWEGSILLKERKRHLRKVALTIIAEDLDYKKAIQKKKQKNKKISN